MSERYKEAFEWLKSTPQKEVEKKTTESKKEGEDEKTKGTRSSEIWSPAIDSLIRENFFKLPNSKTKKDVMKALADKALPTQGKDKVIVQTLTRKVRKGSLKGTRSPEGWTFWTE